MKAFWCLFLAACVAAPPPSPPRQTKLDIDITTATLENGLRVVLVRDPKAAEVQVTMRYRAGAIDDPAGQEGVAHLVEHLMFQQVLGSQSLFAKLEDAASSFNAFTTLDATTYVTRANATRLEELLSIEAVRLGYRCTSINDSVFTREREVVLNELRLKDTTRALLQAVHAGVYPEGHPYRRIGSGTEASVGAITREQACAFADAHYAPANAVLVVSGAVTATQLDAALEKFLAKLPKRDTPPRAVVPPVPAQLRRVDVNAPIDDEAVLVAWPLPKDRADRSRVLAAAGAVIASISARLGAAQPAVLGDQAAAMYGILVVPPKEMARQKALDAIRSAIDEAPHVFMAKPAWLSEVVFSKLKQSAIYDLFANLEEGSDRDTLLAASVLAGSDPDIVLGAQAGALRSMTAEDMADLVSTNLRYERATIVVLSPDDNVKQGAPATLATPIHDIGQRRDPPDPEDATRPAADSVPLRPLAGMRTRTLANGLAVVLLPVTSIPTVEMRLVFRSGTADEPVAHRGAAIVSAKALEWNPRYISDLLLFAAGGGSHDVDVGRDHTAFVARGMNMHIDLLLAGLRRWVRDGIYDPEDLSEVRDAEKTGEADITWRTALFGMRHPYTRANMVSGALSREEVTEFHEHHHTPGNATLVIAGRFDADLADKWIDYLFTDWTGSAPPSQDVATTPKATAIAQDDTIGQARLRIAIPATHGSRAAKLIAANMLAQIARDVRHQLGASYAFDASLEESRLATSYIMDGWVDAPHAAEAVELLRTRLTALHEDTDAAARAFVTARKRAITQLLRTTSSARELAERVEHDVALERAPLFDAQTAVAANKLTVADMTDVLAELELARAVILVRGPTEHIDRAFAALGRTPTRLAMKDNAEPSVKLQGSPDTFSVDDVEAPITRGPPPSPFAFGAYLGYTVGRASEEGVMGPSVGLDFGYRVSRKLAAGAHLSIGSLSGSIPSEMLAADDLTIDARPVRLAGFLQFTPQEDRLWGAVYLGGSFVHVFKGRVGESSTGLALGAQGGYEVSRIREHHFSVYGSLDADLGSDAGYASFTFGFGYRR